MWGIKREKLVLTKSFVGSDDLLTVTPEIMEQDFRTSVIGTLVTGQWYGKYAAKHEIATSEDTAFPLFLVTAGILHRVRPCFGCIMRNRKLTESDSPQVQPTLPSVRSNLHRII